MAFKRHQVALGLDQVETPALQGLVEVVHLGPDIPSLHVDKGHGGFPVCAIGGGTGRS